MGFRPSIYAPRYKLEDLCNEWQLESQGVFFQEVPRIKGKSVHILVPVVPLDSTATMTLSQFIQRAADEGIELTELAIRFPKEDI